MIHLDSFTHYLKLSWIKRYLINPDGNWQSLLLLELKKYGGDRVFHSDKDKLKEVSNFIKNQFWKDTLCSLSKAKPIVKLCIKEIMSLDILNYVPVTNFNDYLVWKESGIEYLKDIVDFDNRTFFSFPQLRQNINFFDILKTSIKHSQIYKRLCEGALPGYKFS